jgi:hypothetical protein
LRFLIIFLISGGDVKIDASKLNSLLSYTEHPFSTMSSRGDDIVLLCAAENFDAITSAFSGPVRKVTPSTLSAGTPRLLFLTIFVKLNNDL